MNLFVRNSPEVVRDSVSLTVEEFVGKYRRNTTEEVLSRAYFEIRRKELIKNPPPPEITLDTTRQFPKADLKKVTFKIIKTKKEDPKKKAPKVEEETDEDETLNELLGIEEEGERQKQKRKRQSSSCDREEQVVELLKAGKKPKEIIEALAAKNITIYAPQISNIRKAHGL